MRRNPYKKARKLPVGELEYPLEEELDELLLEKSAMLEFGEQELIFDIPRLVNGGNLLNLGDGKGGSAILLAKGLQARSLKGHVYTVDNYGDADSRRAFRNYEEAGVEEIITQCRGTTDHMIEVLKYIEFRFIFIDADHEYEGVKNDWLNYSNLLADEVSLIAFHDTNWEGTDKVIQEELNPKKWELVNWVNRIKVFKRRPY